MSANGTKRILQRVAGKLRLRGPRALERIRNEPSTLDADMTPPDIADTLKRLKFVGGYPETIKLIDSETSDGGQKLTR